MGTLTYRTMPHLSLTQYDLVYNMTSFGLASMAASTVFFFLRISSFAEKYRAALCFTGLVTFIAMYHYFRIFNSFEKAYTPCKVTNGIVDSNDCNADTYGYNPTGHAFNDAYRYVDWLLTVPLLLIEIVLVMGLDEDETFNRCCTLGISSALMIAFGYPGETSGDVGKRWVFWCISMTPFCYIVYTLFIGLAEAQANQAENVRAQVKWACWATVFSWCTYPIVYTFSDVISKCGVGYLVYRVGLAKSANAHSKLEDADPDSPTGRSSEEIPLSISATMGSS